MTEYEFIDSDSHEKAWIKANTMFAFIVAAYGLGVFIGWIIFF